MEKIMNMEPLSGILDEKQRLKGDKDDPKLWVKSPYPDIQPPWGVELQELIMDKMAQYGNLAAMTCGITGRTMTYRQILKQAQALGATLLQAGYQKGEIAALCLGNVLEFPMILLGCWCAGLSVVCLNPRYTDQETLRQFRLVKVQLAFAEEETINIVEEARREHSEIRHVVLVGDIASSEQGFLHYSEMIKTCSDGASFSSGKVSDSLESVAWLALSSGTTGPPKLVKLTHAFLATNLIQFIQNDIGPTKAYTQTGEQERTVALLPFFHGYGFWVILLIGLYQGCHIMCLPRFKPDTFLQAIQTHRPTCLHLATPLISHLVNSPEYTKKELESVHTVMGGGAPVGNVLINKLIDKAERFITYTEIYGMTEVLLTHILNPSSRNTKLGSCGRCTPSTMSKVVDIQTGETLGANQKGEIMVKPPLPVKGYYQNELATATLLDSNGWVHTGDIGYYDNDGYFFVVDRIKELIKVKAFQVAPSELEDLLRKHPKVADCAVIGIPSVEHGEVPRAYVVAKEGETITERDIHNYMNPIVASFKHLKGGVQVVSEIEKTPSGKILRKELKEKYKRLVSSTKG